MNFYQFIIPRLNGKDIERDFDFYKGLVEKGIAGFIIFGGELKTIRPGLAELQKISKTPLMIASDLERGLGQQVEGGTLFPPAMAIASAIKKSSHFSVSSSKLKLLKNTFKAVAQEARYAGINTIFAPVLDINTNPKNPIISTRAFGEDPETVSFFGIEMIKVFQSNGIAACGKHFPGHGDTEIDSHISLPAIQKNLSSLEKTELLPFRKAIRAGVKMIMLGHLKVPALDKTGIPVSLSAKAVKYLREKMKFKGLVITDALNMGGIGDFSEEEASAMALRAGVDILLHPTDVEKIVSYLEKSNLKLRAKNLELSVKRLEVLSSRFQFPGSQFSVPSSQFNGHRKLSEELAREAIKVSGGIGIKGTPFLIILNDDCNDKGSVFAEALGKKISNFRFEVIKPESRIRKRLLPQEASVIVAIFSGIKAWKGGPSLWLMQSMKILEGRAETFISFGSPYILDGIRDDITKIYAYWDSAIAQKAVAEMLCKRGKVGNK